MDYFDFIKELRKGEPNIKKAVKATKILGWICILGAVWNFVLPLISPSGDESWHLPESYPFVALVSLSITGILFLISSRGIRQRTPWGVRTAQTSVILLLGIIVLFGMTFFLITENLLPEDTTPRVFFVVVFTIVFGQFLIPGFFGLRYLGKLPVQKTGLSEMRFGMECEIVSEVIETKSPMPGQERKYKDALFPFGVGGTFVLLLGSLMLTVFAVEKFADRWMASIIFMIGFAVIFFGPMIYNGLSSPFERGREIIASYTGGGSASLMGGTWPFFKLIVYEDGLEVRVMFHRFFIPYESMEDIPEKVGFFSRGILIKSDLPGVPCGIRFGAFGMKKKVQTIIEARRKHLQKRNEGVAKDPTAIKGGIRH